MRLVAFPGSFYESSIRKKRKLICLDEIVSWSHAFKNMTVVEMTKVFTCYEAQD